MTAVRVLPLGVRNDNNAAALRNIGIVLKMVPLLG